MFISVSLAWLLLQYVFLSLCKHELDWIQSIKSTHCPIIYLEEFQDFTQACTHFELNFLGKEQVILRKDKKRLSSKDMHFKNITAKQNFIKLYHHLQVQLSTANAYTGRTWVRGTLGDVIDELLQPMTLQSHSANDTFYLFGSTFGEDWETLLHLYEGTNFPSENSHATCTSSSSELDLVSESFGIGGKYSGVPFHFHGPGFLEIIHGKKLFFIYPSGYNISGYNPDSASLLWTQQVFRTLPEQQKPAVCELLEEDILYFPNGVLHATLNLAEYNVFVASFK